MRIEKRDLKDLDSQFLGIKTPVRTIDDVNKNIADKKKLIKEMDQRLKTETDPQIIARCKEIKENATRAIDEEEKARYSLKRHEAKIKAAIAEQRRKQALVDRCGKQPR